MSIAFGGAMKDSEDDALNEAMRGMRKTASTRKRIVAIKPISKRRRIWQFIFLNFG